ncbi:kinase-like domain, phloem protein 2-like protein [Tanacetum coccineum]
MATFLNNFQHLEIQIEEIISATNNFDDSRVIGSGGFGNVYKGEITLPEGKSMVAFKRLDRKHGQGDPEFLKEIIMLSSYKHDNLISLLGFCKEGDEMILIYQYASQGSLDRILNDANLTWTQRLKICLGAAKGLGFLHDPNGSQQRVIHRDIKSANILLDEILNAKVSDFGLSRISPANQKYTFLVTSPVGTPGYCDPLYMDAYQLTKESDVYSFGVVLFEVLCGRVCYEYSNGNLKVFVHFWKKCYEQNKLDEIIFPDIRHQLDPSSFKTFVDIAYQCLQKTREQRPTMSVVVEKLNAALELKELHDLKLQREYEQEEMRKAAEYEAEQMRKAAEYEAEQMRKAAEYEAEQIRKAAGYEHVEILRLADPPLIYKSMEELKALLSKGFLVNGGKTVISHVAVWSGSFADAQTGSEISKQRVWETFCEDICVVKSREDMKNSNMTCCYFVTNKMDDNLYMFGALMLYWVCRLVYGTDIITVDQGRCEKWGMKLTKEVVNPRCLSYSIRNPAVFSLNTGMRQSVLTFGGPRQEVVNKKNTISRSRSTRSRTTCPVSIRVCNKL